MQHLRDLNASVEQVRKSHDFATLAALVAVHGRGAHLAAKEIGASSRVVEILTKAAVLPGTTGDWSGLADYSGLVSGFAASMRHVSVFDAV